MARNERFPGLLSLLLALCLGAALWSAIIAALIAQGALPAAASRWLLGLAARSWSNPIVRLGLEAVPVSVAALLLTHLVHRSAHARRLATAAAPHAAASAGPIATDAAEACLAATALGARLEQ